MVQISEFEYNLALFEVGCAVMEGRYSVEIANVILKKSESWSWLKIQQKHIDREVSFLIKASKAKGCKAVELYRKELEDHLEGVYFNARFEKKILQV